MVPGTVERDTHTSREQWNDWWRTTAPQTGRALHHVNTGARWTWRPAIRWRSGPRLQEPQAGWGWFRPGAPREALTGS